MAGFGTDRAPLLIGLALLCEVFFNFVTPEAGVHSDEQLLLQIVGWYPLASEHKSFGQ